ncbi:hypothetical protein [Actinomadura bangladeshensis]|uniref:hypothetical protein n=1 Tax=Actinomadura bangladeshensis TaxID=453573 RepID=UPI001943EFC2|nr:hypothetical protein [Actinomadura bangladeshensis]
MDTGYLGLWSGEASPVMDEDVLAGMVDPEMRDSVRAAADFAIVGPDAEAAARTFDRQPGTWLYDVPEHGIEKLTASFDAHCRERGLDARLECEAARVPHRERVRRCVVSGGQGFFMHGAPVVAIGGLPIDREIGVTAVGRDFGRIGTRWESVSINIGSGEPGSPRLLGHVGVDAARLSLADADGLAAWRHEEPIDGMADVAFWGYSVQAAAGHFGARTLPASSGDGVHGWADLPVGEALDRAVALQEWLDAGPERRLVIEFRPHSHHWQVMAQVRAAEHEVGTIEVGDTRTMCFMTGWGDGFFPVYADHDGAGRLVRIRIVLGDEERQRRLEAMYDRA